MIDPTPHEWWDGFITGILTALAWGSLAAAYLYSKRQRARIRAEMHAEMHARHKAQAEKRERES
jgi:hypothetical protein